MMLAALKFAVTAVLATAFLVAAIAAGALGQ